MARLAPTSGAAAATRRSKLMAAAGADDALTGKKDERLLAAACLAFLGPIPGSHAPLALGFVDLARGGGHARFSFMLWFAVLWCLYAVIVYFALASLGRLLTVLRSLRR